MADRARDFCLAWSDQLGDAADRLTEQLRAYRAVEDEILARLDRGDLWAWCHVVVTARWNGYVGEAHLGGCSYADEESFRHPGGYYPQMQAEALAALNAVVADRARTLIPLMV